MSLYSTCIGVGVGVGSTPHTEPILEIFSVQVFCAACHQVHADHDHLLFKQKLSYK